MILQEHNIKYTFDLSTALDLGFKKFLYTCIHLPTKMEKNSVVYTKSELNLLSLLNIWNSKGTNWKYYQYYGEIPY